MRNPFSTKVRIRDGFPVVPGAFPLIGHIPMAYRGLPEAVRAAREIGNVSWIHAGFGMWVLFCTGKGSLEILRNKAFSSEFLKETAPLVAGESLLSQDGETHRRMRSAMNGPFMPKGITKSAFGKMSATMLRDLALQWAAAKRAKVLPEIQTVALDIIFRMLGVPIEDIEPWRQKYRDLVLANLNIKLRFPGSPAIRSERAKEWINEQLRGIIEEARKSEEQTTLISALVHQKSDDARPLSETELIDNLRLVILGGHETISSTMAWMLLHLAHKKELWDTLVQEAAKAERVPETPEEARAFPFAEALFRETVRSHPAFPTIGRRVVAPFELYGKALPIGALVSVDLWGISHDESLFPEPMAFRPGRWIEKKSAPSAMEVSQFGFGPHFCVGYHLALLEGIQFAVSLAMVIGKKGLRPVLRSESDMAPIYMPTDHPTPKATVDFR